MQATNRGQTIGRCISEVHVTMIVPVESLVYYQTELSPPRHLQSIVAGIHARFYMYFFFSELLRDPGAQVP